MKTRLLAVVLVCGACQQVAKATTWAEVNSMRSAQFTLTQNANTDWGVAKDQCRQFADGTPEFDAALEATRAAALKMWKHQTAYGSLGVCLYGGVENPDEEADDLSLRIDFHFANFLYYAATGATETYSVTDRNGEVITYEVNKWDRHGYAAQVCDDLRY